MSRYRPSTLVLAAIATLVLGCKAESSSPAGAGDQPAAAPAPAAAETTDWKILYDRWDYPDPIPNFELVDHRGRELRLAQFRDDYLFIGFIFTRCPMPEACPLTTEKMARLQIRWREAAPEGKSLHLLSVTMDPDFDTPEVLARYAEDRDLDLSNWTFATGPKELVADALPSLFGILALEKAPGRIQHTVKGALLKPGLVIAREWKDNSFEAREVIDLIAAAE